MTYIRSTISILLITLSFGASGQKAAFLYETDMCSCKGVFDSTTYSRAALQNTFEFLVNSSYIHTDAYARTLEKVKEISSAKLNQECTLKLEKLNNLEFINNKFWNQLKKERIIEIESTCLLRQYTISAWKNPDTLMSYSLVDSTCIFYRDALISGGQKMLDAWVVLNENLKKKNGDPEKLQRKFDEQFNSVNRLDYARLELMSFGWWSSANRLIFHVNESGEFEDEFKKLFIKVKCECDEP